jgi:hypothetical protein
MTVLRYMTAALFALPPAAAFAAEGSLRGSTASMNRQHDVAIEEELTFYRTPGAVLAEVAAGVLTELPGNDDYRVANVSFAYAVPEVRMFVERIAQQYRQACGERLVVTSLTRPKTRQPRNAHELSVHPAGMAVDLRISNRSACRTWIEATLLSLEQSQVIDVTRERTPPHYHVAVFPTPYKEYVQRIDAKSTVAVTIAPAESKPAVVHAAMMPLPKHGPDAAAWATAIAFVAFMLAGLMVFVRRPKSA